MATDAKAPLIDPDIVARCKAWPRFLEAKLGLRNHWYPSRFSDELREGVPVRHQLCGESMLLNRVNGKVFAVRDQCAHRGVPLSHKVECFTEETITCWYHGWTYRWDTGQLVDILTQPSSKAIGRHGLRTYPVEEAKGIAFVFIGDMEPPPLSHDVPPEFLDDNMVIRGVSRPVHSNWRLGVENGFDTTHIYMHKESRLLHENQIYLPIGFECVNKQGYRLEEGPGWPRGVYDEYPDYPIEYGRIGGEVVTQGSIDVPEESKRNPLVNSTSIWLPCVLKVEPWPNRDLIQFEWYVPADAENHWYMPTLGRRVKNKDEEKQWHKEFDDKWMNLAVYQFNDDDVFARQALQTHYEDDAAWLEEGMFEPDVKIIAWRRLVHGHARGIQTPKHL